MLRRLRMGSVVKCVATYQRPFWREAGDSGWVLADDAVVQEAYDLTSADGAPALVAFSYGDRAIATGNLTPARRQQTVLEALARFFGDAAREPTGYLELDWRSEPWTQGGWHALVPPGWMLAGFDQLREPFGRIHWAGTETASRFHGYVEGALRSGERAAREILVRAASPR